jgi:hypothetical protein
MVRSRREQMRSSVEGLKLRRIRLRNEISFSRWAEEGPASAEELGALHEELRGLNKQIEEAEYK